MMIAPPLVMQWDGEALRPLHRERAATRFEAGKNYQIEVVESRSEETHRHYFACVREAWANLSDAQRNRWPTPEHLRAWALISAGYHTEKAYVCSSPVEALRLKSVAETMDEFAVVVMRGKIVAVFRAKSQSYKAMGRDEFQKSKDSVLVTLAALIGVTPDELAANAGAST